MSVLCDSSRGIGVGRCIEGEMREGVGDGEDEYDYPLPLNALPGLAVSWSLTVSPVRGAVVKGEWAAEWL